MTNKELKEQITNKVSADIKGLMTELFPDNKIPIMISPINEYNSEYITWNAYSSTGPYNTFADNFCRPNDVGTYQYPTETGLEDCNEYFPSNIIDMSDLNSFIKTELDNVNFEDDAYTTVGSNTKKQMEDKLTVYKSQKADLAKQEKLIHNLKNIQTLLKKLNEKYQKDENNTENAVAVNLDSVDTERFKYLNTQYYLYIIGALVIVVLLLQITVFVY